jgi:multiple sugar transport system substrate-binding protein
MIRNQIFRTLAVMVLFGGLALTACGSPSRTPAADATTAVVATATPTPSPSPTPTIIPALSLDPGVLKGVKLTFIHSWSGAAGQAANRITHDFNEKNVWGIRVEPVMAGSTGEAYYLIADAIEHDGRPPAGVAAAPPDHAAAWEKMRTGTVIDLSPFITNPEWGMDAEEIENYYPAIWNQTIQAGRQVGIPAQRSLQVLVYNQTWAEELGFNDIPVTSTQFQEQVCAATHANLVEKKPDKSGTGGFIYTTDPSMHLAWMSAFGFDPMGLDEQRGYIFSGPEAEASFTYLRKLFDRSCAWLSKIPQPFDYFAARQSLAYAASLMDLPLQEAAMQAAENADRWTVIPFTGDGSRTTTLQTGLNFIILDSNPPEELASWVFMHWLMLPRHQAELAEAGSSLPLSKSAAEALETYGKNHPQWLAGAALLEDSVPVPVEPGWRVVRRVLEDASWQLIQPTLQPVPEILRHLDETIPEVIQ